MQHTEQVKSYILAIFNFYRSSNRQPFGWHMKWNAFWSRDHSVFRWCLCCDDMTHTSFRLNGKIGVRDRRAAERRVSPTNQIWRSITRSKRNRTTSKKEMKAHTKTVRMAMASVKTVSRGLSDHLFFPRWMAMRNNCFLSSLNKIRKSWTFSFIAVSMGSASANAFRKLLRSRSFSVITERRRSEGARAHLESCTGIVFMHECSARVQLICPIHSRLRLPEYPNTRNPTRVIFSDRISEIFVFYGANRFYWIANIKLNSNQSKSIEIIDRD